MTLKTAGGHHSIDLPKIIATLIAIAASPLFISANSVSSCLRGKKTKRHSPSLIFANELVNSKMNLISIDYRF